MTARESFGQVVDLCASIRGVLDNYPSGIGIIKELVQNADDARASTVRFVHDRRLLHTQATSDAWKSYERYNRELMGPALLVYNDAVFTDKDFESIRNIADSIKRLAMDKTGRFGLGFNSSYHVCDAATFVSRNYVVCFDPQCKYLPNRDASNPGERFNVLNPEVSASMQLPDCPFRGLRAFGSDLAHEWPQTLFRFPLRTPSQAKDSRICKSPHSAKDIDALLSRLKDEAPVILMFVNSVKTIEWYDWPEHGDAPVLLYSATKTDAPRTVIDIPQSLNICDVTIVQRHFPSVEQRCEISSKLSTKEDEKNNDDDEEEEEEEEGQEEEKDEKGDAHEDEGDAEDAQEEEGDKENQEEGDAQEEDTENQEDEASKFHFPTGKSELKAAGQNFVQQQRQMDRARLRWGMTVTKDEFVACLSQGSEKGKAMAANAPESFSYKLSAYGGAVALVRRKIISREGVSVRFASRVGCGEQKEGLGFPRNCMGRVCNTLPLPESIASRLPILINGNFELSSSRRDVWWGSDVGLGVGKFRIEWNLVMATHEIAPCYAHLLLALCQTPGLCWSQRTIQGYWPQSVSDESIWAKLIDSTFVQMKNLPVLGGVKQRLGLRWHAPAVARQCNDFEVAHYLNTIGAPVVETSLLPTLDENFIACLSAGETRTWMRTLASTIPPPFHVGIRLLRMCLADGNTADLEGVPLLPLEHSNFAVFHKTLPQKWKICAHQREIFLAIQNLIDSKQQEGFNSNFVMANLPLDISGAIERLTEAKSFNIVPWSPQHIEKVLSSFQPFLLWRTHAENVLRTPLELMRPLLKELGKLPHDQFVRLVTGWPLIATTAGHFRCLHAGPLLCPMGLQDPNMAIVQLLRQCGVDVVDLNLTYLPADLDHEAISHSNPRDVTNLLQTARLDTLNVNAREQLFRFLVEGTGLKARAKKICRLRLFRVMGQDGFVGLGLQDRNLPHLVGVELEKKSDIFENYDALMGYVCANQSITSELLEKLGIPTDSFEDFVQKSLLPSLQREPFPRRIVFVSWLLSGPRWEATNSSFKLILAQTPFVPIPGNSVLVRPKDLLWPRRMEERTSSAIGGLEEVVEQHVILVPELRINEEVLQSLYGLGLRQSLDCEQILATALSIASTENRTRSIALLKYISCNLAAILEGAGVGHKQWAKKLCAIKWLPTKQLEAENLRALPALPPCVLASASEVSHWKPWLVSASLYDLEPCVDLKAHTSLVTLFEWDVVPPHVFAQQLLALAAKQQQLLEDESELEYLHAKLPKVTTQLYSLLAGAPATVTQPLLRQKIIWIPEELKFVEPEAVAFNVSSEFDLRPHVRALPKQYLMQTLRPFFVRVGVQEDVCSDHFCLILQALAESAREQKELPKEQVHLAVRIAQYIANLRHDKTAVETSEVLYLPTAEGSVRLASEVMYGDGGGETCNELGESGYSEIHQSISAADAEILGAVPYSDILGDGDIFTQTVDTVAFIRSVMNDYPISDIFKEFIQNSDDAKATNFHIVIDERGLSHSQPINSKHLFGGEACPAIYIFNDSQFSEADFTRLSSPMTTNHKPVGSIGHHVKGFNSCFGVTDTPCVLSDRILVMLDPSHSVFKHGGKRFNLSSKATKVYPGLEMLFDRIDTHVRPSTSVRRGTIFRFPLRTTETNLSRNKVNSEILSQLIQGLKAEAAYLMLFLRHVCSLQLSVWHEDAEAPSHKFQLQVRRTNISNTDEKNCTLSIQKTEFYDSNPSDPVWSFATSFASVKPEIAPSSGKKQHKLQARTDGSMLLGAVAFPIPLTNTLEGFRRDTKQRSSQGRLFCFLPIAEVPVPFVMHVHGGFQMESSRRSLNEKNPWNIQVRDHAISRAYTHGIHYARKLVSSVSTGSADGRQGVNELEQWFYGLWPNVGGNFNSAEETFWQPLSKSVSSSLLKDSPMLMNFLSQSDGKVGWTPIDHGMLPDTRVFSPEELSALARDGLPLVSLSGTMAGTMNFFGGKKMDAHSLCNFLSRAASRFRWNAESVISYSQSPLLCLSSHKLVSKMLGYATTSLNQKDSKKDPIDLSLLPLLPLENEQHFCMLIARRPGTEKLVRKTKRLNLCELPGIFVHSDCKLDHFDSKILDQLGVSVKPTVSHILEFMRVKYPRWELKTAEEVHIPTASEKDVAWLKQLWMKLYTLKKLPDLEKFLNWAIVPTMGGSLIKLRAVRQALIIQRLQDLEADVLQGLHALGLHVVNCSLWPQFLDLNFREKMAQHFDKDQDVIGMLSKNRERFDNLMPDRRFKLRDSLLKSCTGPTALSALMALPLYQTVFGTWISLEGKADTFAEMETPLPPQMLTLFSRFVLVHKIVHTLPRDIHAQLIIAKRTRKWTVSDFLKSVLEGKHYGRDMTLFEHLNPAERQLFLSLAHLPLLSSQIPTPADFRLTSAMISNSKFIPHGKDFLSPKQVFDSGVVGLDLIVQLLGLPCVSDFFAAQAQILKVATDSVRENWKQILLTAGMQQQVPLDQFQACAKAVERDPNLARFSLDLCTYLASNCQWWMDEKVRSTKFVVARRYDAVAGTFADESHLNCINDLYHPHDLQLVFTQASFLPDPLNALFPHTKVLVPIVLEHLKQLCRDFQAGIGCDKLLDTFEHVFAFLNSKATKPGPRNLLAALANERIWPLPMVFGRGELRPANKLLSVGELCFDMDLSPYIFKVSSESRLATFPDLLRATGVAGKPSMRTLVRVVNGFAGDPLKDPSRRLDVILKICAHCATVPELGREIKNADILIPCKTPDRHVLQLFPATSTVFVDKASLQRRLNNNALKALRFVSDQLGRTDAKNLGALPLSEILRETPVTPLADQIDKDMSTKLTALVQSPELSKYLKLSRRLPLIVTFVRDLKAELVLVPGLGSQSQTTVSLGDSCVPWCMKDDLLFIGAHPVSRIWEDALVQALTTFLSPHAAPYRGLALLCSTMFQLWPNCQEAVEIVQGYLEDKKPKNDAPKWRHDEQALDHPSLAGAAARVEVVFMDEQTEFVPSDGDSASIPLSRWLQKRSAPIDLDDFKRLGLRVLQGIGYMHQNNDWLGSLCPHTVIMRDSANGRMPVIDVHGSNTNNQFLAPELRLEKLDPSDETLRMGQDMYSFGALLVFCAPPALQAKAVAAFSNHPHFQEFYLGASTSFSRKSETKTEKKEQVEGADAFLDLLGNLLCMKPEMRFVAEKALTHSFFVMTQLAPKRCAGLPQTWTGSRDNFQLVAVEFGSLEYKNVEGHYTANHTHPPRLISVSRVQSPELWQRYDLSKNQMQKRLGNAPFERWLFHGTDSQVATSIAECGMDMRLCGKNAVVWGQGIYFAVSAAYSANDMYSVPDRKGEKTIFLSQVLVGKFTKGSEKFKRPPAVDPAKPNVLYDSVSDSSTNPTMFVIFENAHAYPAYLIKCARD